ncbi:MAG: hypothetical protein ACPGEG_09700 [Salibacteraceae bacterium]
MKRILSTTILLAIVSMSFGQVETEKLKNKKGLTILPEKGNFGLGFNAVPFFNYLGNTFNGTANNTIGTDFVNSTQSIYGKYFLKDDLAIRAEFRFAVINRVKDNYVLRDNGAGQNDFVRDTRKTSASYINIGLGAEKRRSWGRIQAFYGASVFYGLTNNKVNYKYGNEFRVDNPTPTFTSNFETGATQNSNKRVAYVYDGSIHDIGARLFVGVEYFFMPRMSIGGEFGWGAQVQIQEDSKTNTSEYNPTTNILTDEIRNSSTEQAFIMDTDNFTGAINLMVYF